MSKVWLILDGAFVMFLSFAQVVRTALFVTFVGLSVSGSASLSYGVASAQAPQPPLALRQGRWVGKFTPKGYEGSLGVVFDVFLSQPNDVRDFPRLEGLVRLALGGPLGHERHASHYKSINYDFSTGELTFDEANSDLVISARVVSDTTIRGTITNALSGVNGPLELVYADVIGDGGNEPCDPDEPCEPPDDPSARIPTRGFLPSLGGTYGGTCNGHKARLEIATGRLPEAEQSTSDLLKGVSLQARLGLENVGQCGVGEGLCIARGWKTGQFDIFLSKLILVSDQAADVCTYGKDGTIACDVRFPTESKSCSFIPDARNLANVTLRPNALKLPLSSEERAPLPSAGSILEPLREKLGGTFSGYLFHERDGHYQPLRFTSVSSISADNPHNEPNVYVSGNIQLHLGSGFNSPFAGFRIDRRTFFASKGMSLRSETSDLILVVNSWTSGALSGVVYSKSSGRIGPFELRRNESAIDFPPSSNLQPSLPGTYASEKPANGNPWTLNAKLTQAGLGGDGLVRLAGSAQIAAPGLPFPPFTIRQGSYDIFSGQLAFLVEESGATERLVTGSFSNANALSLWIPSSEAWGVRASEPRALKFARK
jgi:hypothetical protein